MSHCSFSANNSNKIKRRPQLQQLCRQRHPARPHGRPLHPCFLTPRPPPLLPRHQAGKTCTTIQKVDTCDRLDDWRLIPMHASAWYSFMSTTAQPVLIGRSPQQCHCHLLVSMQAAQSAVKHASWSFPADCCSTVLTTRHIICKATAYLHHASVHPLVSPATCTLVRQTQGFKRAEEDGGEAQPETVWKDDGSLPVDGQGQLPFFLLDAHEEASTPGLVYLFGKVSCISA